MEIQRIPFQQVPQLSERDVAYATGSPELKPFYKYEVILDAFAQVINDRKKHAVDRRLLVNSLRDQYAGLDVSKATQKNIDALVKENTFTVTTAHQPSLFTGPLYYIYKIFSTINLAGQLNNAYPDYHFVPVFISGAEDHDFAEVNHANLFNNRIEWHNEEEGPVGFMKTASLSSALGQLKEILGDSEAAQKTYALIEKAYTSHERYGDATIHLVNSFFRDYGLVIVDMSRADLKQRFIPYAKKELLEQPSKELVEAVVEKLEGTGFSQQAHAREINLFYLGDQYRERIVLENGKYQVLNAGLSFSEAEILTELEAHPERFSPNVVMRPIYQEVVLPNLAYIGGGGELAYWLERKSQFEYFGVNYPMLIRRNSVLWIDKGSAKRIEKLGLQPADLFRDVEQLVKDYVRENTENELSLTEEKQQLEAIFEQVARKAEEIDPTLKKAVLADGARQLKSLENLEGRLMRAEKQRHDTAIGQIRSLSEKLFPGNGLQERYDNFLTFYLRYGDTFFEVLRDNLNPLEAGFIVVYDN